jgi:phosphoribosyl 1,2-cyclic phosphate phosphodiesterase
VTVRLLGTGAADGIPGFFSKDRVSQYARAHGGKDVRSRSGALIDGILKIDLPPDTFIQMRENSLEAGDWSALVFTHSHEDHCAVSEIQYALYPFTELELLPFQIFGNSSVEKKVFDRYPEWPIDFIELKEFQEYWHLGYRITPIRAHHEPNEPCFNLLIEREKRLLYATDTGIWDSPTFEFLARKSIDCLIIECTEGLNDSDYEGHLNIAALAQVLDRLRKSAAISPSGIVVTTHHAHTGLATHAELTAALKPIGAMPGYDGMVFEL